jgi:hypothetical protein
MPLPKPKAALLFNNYFDENSLSKLEQPLDIELILAGAYYNFIKGEGRPLMLDEKVPFSENSDFKSEYKNIFQLPNNGGHIPVGIYNSNFVEITTDNINVLNVANLFNEFEFTSGKTLEGNKETTTIYISSNLYAALDGIFSVGGDEKLAVPFVAGEDVSAAAASGQTTPQGIPLGEIGNLPAGAGQSDSSMIGGLESVEGIDIGQIFTDSTGAGAGSPVFNPMSDSGGTQPPPTPPGLPGAGDEL